jgi:hypothetical protein
MRLGRLDGVQNTGADDRLGAAGDRPAVGTADTRRDSHHDRGGRPLRGQPGRARDRQGRLRITPRPRSSQAWNPEPLAGNFNECAQLSAVIVKANTNSENPNTRAVLFHLGKFIPTGVPDTYGFNGIDDSTTTGDTIALRYSSGVEGLDSVVKFRWNGNGVELIGNTG